MSKKIIPITEVKILGDFLIEGRHSATISTDTEENIWVEVLHVFKDWSGNQGDITFVVMDDSTRDIFQPHRHDLTADGLVCVFEEENR